MVRRRLLQILVWMSRWVDVEVGSGVGSFEYSSASGFCCGPMWWKGRKLFLVSSWALPIRSRVIVQVRSAK